MDGWRCGPLKILKDNVGKASRLCIFGLVIKDHIESIGKPILLKGDDVLIMSHLLKCLKNCPKTLNHILTIQSVQNPKAYLGPTETTHPDPPRYTRQSHQPNPRNSVPPRWHSVPPKCKCQVSVSHRFHFGITEWNRSELPRWGNCLSHHTSEPPSGFIRSHWNI